MGKTNPCLQYHLDNCPLNKVPSHIDLGVTITSDLSWSEHILTTCKRANSMLYLLRRTFVHVSFKASIQLYKTYVRPLLEYAGPVWCPVLVRDQSLLESVQRRATRVTFGLNRPTYPDRLKMANLLSFQERRLRGDLIMSFRILNFNYANISSLYSLNSDNRLRGHKYKLKKEKFKTKHRQYYITNRIFETWNNLPSDIIDSTSINIFKNKLDIIIKS